MVAFKNLISPPDIRVPHPFIEKWLPVKETPLEKLKIISPQKHYENFFRSIMVKHVILQIIFYQLDLTKGYDLWRDIGSFFANEFGEEGRYYYHIVSQFNDTYTPNECDSMFDRCLRGERQGLTKREFFRIAKKAGCKIPTAKTPWLDYFMGYW